MREIRFRAWDGQRFYYFDNHAYTLDYNDASGWGVHPNTPDYDRGPWTTGESSSTAEHFDLQQYTGLKDKNKKWIYEGDIIQTMNPFSEKHTAYVVWDTAQSMYTWMIGETWMLHFIDGIAEDKNAPLYPYCQPRSGFEITVIGNVHQNPELLKRG